MPERDDIEATFNENLDRVRNLMTLYEDRFLGTVSGRRAVGANDVLRAATVLLHATLEDFLREIARWKLPAASQEELAEVPVAGFEGKTPKLTLGVLVRFRGRTVDELFTESVREYLGNATYNNVANVKRVLEAISLDPSLVDPFADALGTMMERRHHIVHRADKNEQTGIGHHGGKSIAVKTVRKWISAVRRFAGVVLDEL